MPERLFKIFWIFAPKSYIFNIFFQKSSKKLPEKLFEIFWIFAPKIIFLLKTLTNIDVWIFAPKIPFSFGNGLYHFTTLTSTTHCRKLSNQEFNETFISYPKWIVCWCNKIFWNIFKTVIFRRSGFLWWRWKSVSMRSSSIKWRLQTALWGHMHESNLESEFLIICDMQRSSKYTLFENYSKCRIWIF